MTPRHRKPSMSPAVRFVCWALFVAYMILLAYFLLFAEEYGRGTFGSGTFHYNLKPFREISRCVFHWETLGLPYVLLNLLGNVVGFMPFGFFLALLSWRERRMLMILLLSLELSLFIEVIQLFTGLGSFDVDDLMLNTLGGLLGYLCYKGVAGTWNRSRKRQEKNGERKWTGK